MPDYHRNEADAHRGVEFYAQQGRQMVAMRDDSGIAYLGLSGCACSYAVVDAEYVPNYEKRGWFALTPPAQAPASAEGGEG